MFSALGNAMEQQLQTLLLAPRLTTIYGVIIKQRKQLLVYV
jgi:hypothetical protein